MSKVSFFKSLDCAIKGIFYGISKQRMLKILLVLGIFAILISLILQVSKPYFLTILTAIFLVIILELFNNNFERLIDRVSPYYDKECGEIKDTMAGVVLLAFILLVIVSAIILYEPLVRTLTIITNSQDILILLITDIILTGIILFVYYLRKKQSLHQQQKHPHPQSKD